MEEGKKIKGEEKSRVERWGREGEKGGRFIKGREIKEKSRAKRKANRFKKRGKDEMNYGMRSKRLLYRWR